MSDLRIVLTQGCWETSQIPWVAELGDMAEWGSASVDSVTGRKQLKHFPREWVQWNLLSLNGALSLLLVVLKLIRDACFFLGPYRMCRLDSSLFIVLTQVLPCLPIVLMRSLVSMCVKLVFSVAEPLKVIGGESRRVVFFFFFVLQWWHCTKGSE